MYILKLHENINLFEGVMYLFFLGDKYIVKAHIKKN